mgnify:CR=1 FL=1|tara:strand:- start:163 stop:543 length:381 start_codon:yes stop_codon:yes gene_type:complete
MEKQFYLQDKRQYVGNDILWWAKDGKGYTTDLRRAHVFTKEEAIKHNQDRETDVPWPKQYIDQKTRPAVDMQHVDIDIALKDTGIKLKQPEKPKREIIRCYHCGRFVDKYDYFRVSRGDACSRCED